MYSPIIMDHFERPRNVGKLADCNAKGVAGDPSSGPFMVLYLRIQAGTIEKASFETYGCPPAIAAGSFLTELIKGQTIEEAAEITDSGLAELLGGVPLGKEHCPQTAISALKAALKAHETPS
jgi:NifU-like protein involved in Fe-S cluster formation